MRIPFLSSLYLFLLWFSSYLDPSYSLIRTSLRVSDVLHIRSRTFSRVSRIYNLNSNSVSVARHNLVQIIEKSWHKVCQFVPQSTLESYEHELREATSLLVLASLRRSAITNQNSKITLQRILAQADVNQDGQVSFNEWFDWLSHSDEQSEIEYIRNQVDPMIESLGYVLSHAVCTMKVASRIENDPYFLIASFIAGGLSSGELDHQVSQTMLSRLPSKTRDLITQALSLESGSLSPSLFSSSSSQSLSSPSSATAFFNQLNRYENERKRIRAASVWSPSEFLESITDTNSYSSSQSFSNQNQTNVISSFIVKNKIKSSSLDMSSSSIYSELNDNISKKSIGNTGKKPILQTIDLSSIPVLTAPSIEDDDTKPTLATLIYSNLTSLYISNSNRSDDLSISNFDNSNDGENEKLKIPLSTITESDSYKIALNQSVASPIPMTSISININPSESNNPLLNLDSSVDKSEMSIILNPSRYEHNLAIAKSQSSITETVSSSQIMNSDLEDSKLVSDKHSIVLSSSYQNEVTDTLEDMYRSASKTIQDIREIRTSLMDFDDKNSASVRQVILGKSEGRQDVISLALSLRTARLQHSITLPNVIKHRVAVETLQIWAPLSFQVGLSSQVPELEVHSYVLLFPQSFSSFLSWFDHFRPLARKLLRQLKSRLQHLLETDPVLPVIATKVTIQSRIKTPSSAFKKMVKSSKQQQQLHDILGLRVIVTENLPPKWIDENYPKHVEDSTENFRDESIISSDEISEGDTESDVQTIEDYIYDDYDDEISLDEDNDHRQDAVWRVYDILQSLCSINLDESNWDSSDYENEWIHDISRFKDYVSNPKPSGYQSLHLILIHRETGIQMEVQIRSSRMHFIAEYGSASHRNYKALALPLESSQSSQ